MWGKDIGLWEVERGSGGKEVDGESHPQVFLKGFS